MRLSYDFIWSAPTGTRTLITAFGGQDFIQLSYRHKSLTILADFQKYINQTAKKSQRIQ